MISRCDLKSYSECDCQSLSTCVAQPKSVAPVIRPERQDIKTAIAFGILVALLAFGGAHVLNHFERAEIARSV